MLSYLTMSGDQQVSSKQLRLDLGDTGSCLFLGIYLPAVISWENDLIFSTLRVVSLKMELITALAWLSAVGVEKKLNHV